MTSFRQIEANRPNALKSTGPTTPDGKRRSAQNATRHGLTSETTIVGLEDVEDYAAFEQAVIADYGGETAVERELALRLASLLWRLRRATAIETGIGCGPIGILNLLSQRVGLDGNVVGLEREPRFVEMARAEIVKRGLGNVTMVQADGHETGLEKGSFDVVHERLVLINVSAREAFLTEMLSLLRPGGTVALEDVDNVSWLCQPAHPSWDILLNAFHTIFHAGGGDGFLGRRLPVLLHAAGVQNIQTKVTVETPPLGDYRRTHLISLIDSVREKIIANGVLDETKLNEHRKALAQHLEDPATTVFDKLLVQCWRQKSHE